jgi:hypothetical protein
MSEMKDCPDFVINAGALMVKVRHGVRSKDDAAKVGIKDRGAMHAAFEDMEAAVDSAIDKMHETTGLDMIWGDGLVHLAEAREAMERGSRRKAYAHMLAGHDAFRKVVEGCGIKTPTNADIARVIGVLNRR